MKVITVGLLLLLITCISSFRVYDDDVLDFKISKSQQNDVTNTILKLQEIIENLQVKKDQEFIELVQWEETKGEFPSSVHFNLFGSFLKTEAGRVLGIPDSNMFVTNFVIYTLLETEKYGTIQISENVIQNGLNAILGFHDGNFPTEIPVYTFWPQVFNSTGNFYSQNPPNLNHLIDQAGGFDNFIIKIAEFLKAYGIVVDMENLKDTLSTYSTVFHIPSDADDSGCNLALGHLLSTVQTDYPSEWASWQEKNTNVTGLFNVFLEYAYRPFSQSMQENIIDQRTYYVIGDFLNEWLDLGYDPASLVLPGTWFNSITQQQKTFPDLQMPFNVNNVDFSVATNSIFGILTSIQSNSDALNFFTQSKDLQNLCISVTRLIEYSINTGIVYNRSDLALLYYPSIYDFSWFVSRLVYNLEEMNLTSSLVEPLPEILSTLSTLMQNNGTNQLLVRMKESQYWDDFLGDNSTTIFGKPDELGEDRFFSTALAVNALIDTWTLPSSQSNSIRQWRSNTPDQVKEAITSASLYISNNILDNPDQTYNAFFSGSVKSSETLTFFYPSNVCMFFNGTDCNSHILYGNQIDDIISGMSGMVSKEEYAQYVGEEWCGEPVPTVFHGYNYQPFPFWSSNSLSYSISMLSLTKFLDLNN